MTEPENPLRERRETINPYLTAAGLIWNRLAWDLRPESWRSRSRIKAWKNRFAGKKAVILCNGPSLLQVDFARLDNVFTFGLNKINLLFDKTDFRPSCIVAVNTLVIDQNRDFFEATDIPLFLDSYAANRVSSAPGRAFLHSSRVPQFARDASVSVFQGGTVTYVALQLAFHMGFTDVALVGCDHSFAAKGPANAVAVSGKEDADHFDPNYFAGGVQWQLPDLFESEVGYTRARQTFEAFDRRIVNATEGGRLEVFDRMSLDEFLASGS